MMNRLRSPDFKVSVAAAIICALMLWFVHRDVTQWKVSNRHISGQTQQSSETPVPPAKE